MTLKRSLAVLLVASVHYQSAALELAPEEFHASRQMACVLAEQSLGYLSEEEYGARTHTLLDAFDDSERDMILAKALGYYDGLMFEIDDRDEQQVNQRLAVFVESSTCASGFEKVGLQL